MRISVRASSLSLFALFCPVIAQAAKISEITESDLWTQALRFLSFQDPHLRLVVLGTLLMGVCCGLLGSFIVVRRLALFGDTLAHAVLPGVALGFLWTQTKDAFAIFVAATLVGFLSTVVARLLQRTTRLREDTVLGLILSGFYGVGIVLFTMIQQMPGSSKTGLKDFFFGQAAALGQADVLLLGVVAALALGLSVLFYKEMLAGSFDPGFARAVGIPAEWLSHALMLLLSFAVVVSIQATGIVLVSALLITPAATAYLLTDRLHRMLFLAVAFGSLSALAGSFFSFLGNDLPTGPFMVLGATLLFVLALFFAPRHGLLPRLIRQFARRRRIHLENALKTCYHVLEAKQFAAEGVALSQFADRRNIPLRQAEEEARALVKNRLASLDSRAGVSEPHEDRLTQDHQIFLTPDGSRRAAEIVRNHRLWELYLTHAADFPTDHVHDNAEQVEHVLGEETVRRLEHRLNNPRTDPHGKVIPSVEDLEILSGSSVKNASNSYRPQQP